MNAEQVKKIKADIEANKIITRKNIIQSLREYIYKETPHMPPITRWVSALESITPEDYLKGDSGTLHKVFSEIIEFTTGGATAEKFVKANREYSLMKSSYWESFSPTYVDSLLDKSMDVDGDIIITDPCYLRTKEEREDINSDYFQFQNSIVNSTIYGDWGCTVYNTDTQEEIGEFCSDSGMVGVYLLDEVIAHNPEYNGFVELPHTATVIRHFKGNVKIIIDRCDNTFEVHVEGQGEDSATHTPINFVSRQTSL